MQLEDNDITGKFAGAVQILVHLTQHWRARARGVIAVPDGVSVSVLTWPSA